VQPIKLAQSVTLSAFYECTLPTLPDGFLVVVLSPSVKHRHSSSTGQWPPPFAVFPLCLSLNNLPFVGIIWSTDNIANKAPNNEEREGYSSSNCPALQSSIQLFPLRLSVGLPAISADCVVNFAVTV